MCSLVGEVQVVSAGRRIPSSEAIKWLSRPVRILVYWPAVHCRYPQQFLQSPAALPSAQLRSEIKGTLSADTDVCGRQENDRRETVAGVLCGSFTVVG